MIDDADKADLFPGVEDGIEDDGEFTYETAEDGSVTVTAKDSKPAPATTGKHFENLAEKLDPSEVKTLAQTLLELIDSDSTSQEERDKKYKEGLQRTGAGGPAPGGADFDGAANVTHPLLMESCIDFSSHAYKELFPADGPCKTKIFGESEAKERERAERICDFMNWQLTEEVSEFEDTLDECLSQVPLAGSQYIKWFWNKMRNRPSVEYFAQDKVLLPESENSFYNSKRVTYVLDLNEAEVQDRINAGMYREIPLTSPGTPEKTQAEQANQKIQGVKPQPDNLDGDRQIYECEVEWDIEGDGPRPYIVTIDELAVDCLSIYRNWEEKDETFQKMQWGVEYPFIRWRGPRSLGLIHIIGGLSTSATGALRALLDSAHINNAQSGIMLKGVGNANSQNVQAPIGGFAKLDVPPNVDDIRKLAMPFPFNPPSPILFELLGWLTAAGKGVVSTAEEKIADAGNQMPVGTALSLMESGAKVFSAIHKRLHRASKVGLNIQYRLNKMYLTKQRVVEELGKLVVKPEDFQGPCPIIPVSDPNIFSETQRVAQMQAVQQMMVQSVSLQQNVFQARNVYKRSMELLRVPDYDEFLVKEPEPKETNPIAENMGMGLGQPAAAFPMQDHFAHIQAHVQFLNDPNFGQNPLIAPGMVPLMAEHLKQHLMMAYARMMYDAASAQTGEPLENFMEFKDAETRAEFDKLMAVVAEMVAKASGEAFKGLQQTFAQLAQQMQAMRPPMPMDPSVVAMKEVERKTAKDQQDAQLKSQEMQGKQQSEVASLDAKRQELAAKNAQAQMAEQAKAGTAQAQLRQKQQAEREKQKNENLRKGAELEQKAKDRQAENIREAERLASEEARNEQDNRTAIAIAAARAVDTSERVGNIKSGKSVTNPDQ